MSKPASLSLALAAALLGFALGAALSRPDAGDGAASVSPDRAYEQVREILLRGDPLERLRELATLLPRMGPEALEGVRRAYDEAALDAGEEALLPFGIWWARFDPEAAVRWTATDWRARHINVVTAVLRSWARRDPHGAWAKASSKRFPLQREFSRDAVISGWDESGQPGLEDFVVEIEDSIERQRMAEVLARRRALSLGPEGALAWADALESPAFRELMRPRVASAVAQMHPEIAARWAEPRIAQAERPTGLPRRIGTRWVRADPEAAMAWLASLPAGPDRGDGVAETFRDWWRNDPVTATAWIKAAPLEPWNEEAFGVYARSMLGLQDPPQALELASRFGDENLRNRTLTIVARTWLQRDREAADAWLQDFEMPDGVRERAYMAKPRPQIPPPRTSDEDLATDY